jgi:toxic protein SymE
MQHQQERSSQTVVPNQAQDYVTQLQNLKQVFNQMEQIRQILQPLRENGFPLAKDSRRLLVQPKHRQSNTWPHTSVPEINLCGKWLQDIGFEPHQHIRVITLNELIIIYPESKSLTSNCS